MILQIPIKHRNKGTNIMYIDEEDLDKIKHLNLTLNYTSNKNTYYAQHRVYRKEIPKYVKTINIHRLIMGLGDFKEDKRIINHIDGNGLNNCKSKIILVKNDLDYINNGCFENNSKTNCPKKISFSIKDVDGVWINPTGLDDES